MSKYRLIQMTNGTVGAVAANGQMPLGIITRRVSCTSSCTPTFVASTTGANVITINEPGMYNVVYNASLVAGAAGIVSASITVNGTTVYTGSVTATAAGTVNLTLPYVIRVCPNCSSTPNNIPANIQIVLGSTAITAGTSNITIERVY